MYRSRACVQLIPSLLRTGKCDSCLGLLENIKHLEPDEKKELSKQDIVKDELSCKNFEEDYDTTYDNLPTFDEDVNESLENSEAPRVIKFTKKIELIDKVKRKYQHHDGKKEAVKVEKSQCQFCNSSRFYSEEKLAKHKILCKKARKKCPFCDYTFGRGELSLIKHVKFFHESQAETETYKKFFLEKVSLMGICSRCGIEYPKQNLKQHIKYCQGKELVTCHICGKEVSVHVHTKHLELHQKDEIEVCPHCGKLYDNKQRLRNHVNVCQRQKGSFKCPECDKVYGTKYGRSGLNSHIRTVHRQEYKYNCDQCGKKFDMKYRLDEHVIAVHDKIKPFICDLCGFKTAKHTNLNIHRKKSHDLEWISKTAFWEMIQSGRHPYISQEYEYLELMRPKTAVLLNQM